MQIPGLTFTILLAASAFAQPPRPQEVASIKPFAPGQGPLAGGFLMDGAQIRAVALSLKAATPCGRLV
jgi:hypothetical protein